MANLDDKKIFEEDYEVLKENFDKLHFIDGVAIYCDRTATQRRVNFGYKNKWPNNYSLVTEEGKFLMDTIAMRLKRFYHKIRINEDGLFKLTFKDNNYLLQHYKSHPPSHRNYTYHSILFDTEGNLSDTYNLNTLKKILSNRKKCHKPSNFYSILNYLERSGFMIVDKKTNIWKGKEGENVIEFNKEREDGLKFITRRIHRPDSYLEGQHVIDKFDNEMSLNDFYKGLVMITNGKKYLKKLSEFYFEFSVDLQK
jgi:hypothetical protein